MPTYQYACTECSAPLEVVQAFTDDALTECPSCGGRLRKQYSAVGIVFKGSGFYRTDSRSSANGSEPAKSEGTKPDTKSDAATSDGSKTDGSKTDGKSDAAKSVGSKTEGTSDKPGATKPESRKATKSSTGGSSGSGSSAA